MKNYKKGFTLIELLVVVAIIGVLASVILASSSGSRNKSADAGVKSNLNTIRGVSELFYSNNGNSFLPSGGVAIGITTPCPTYVAGGTNMIIRDRTIADAIAEAVKQGGNGSSCYNSSVNWAVAVGLKTSANTSWCVDSGGASRQVNSVPGSAISAGGACL